MKERVYGWYPAADEIYISNKQPHSYEKECLYQHWRSTYSNKPVSKNDNIPATPTSVKISLSPRPHRRSAPPSRTASSQPAAAAGGGAGRPYTAGVPYRSESRKVEEACLRMESRADPPPRVWSPEERRSDSADISVKIRYRASPSCQQNTGAGANPKKAWSMHIPETPVTSFVPRPPSNSAACRLPPGHECDNLNIRTPENRHQGTPPTRARSATYYRPRSTAPSRPVKSAGTTRPSPAACSAYYRPETTKSERPRAPVPPSPYEDIGRCPSPFDYDEQLEKHGWRMEVPGDPLNLKRPCIVKRLPVTYKVKIPTVPPNPPKAKMTNYETFFLNTIPRKPMSFTIHPEWVSEVLHAKRMELQKREGYKYKCNDFGFVY